MQCLIDDLFFLYWTQRVQCHAYFVDLNFLAKSQISYIVNSVNSVSEIVNSVNSVRNLAIRWHHLYSFEICPSDGATCNGSKFGHQVAPLALVPNLATKWRHLHQFLIWSPGGATCIVPKFGPNMLFAVCCLYSLLLLLTAADGPSWNYVCLTDWLTER